MKMLRVKASIGLFLVVAFLIACTSENLIPQGQATETPAPSSTPDRIAATATPTVAVIETQSSSEAVGESIGRQYHIQAVYDHGRKIVEVTQRIDYQNETESRLDELVLIIEPNRYANGFDLISITRAGEDQSLGYRIDVNRLQVDLNVFLEPGDSIEIELVYTIKLPQIPPPSDMLKPQIFGYTARQTNLVDWYAFIPPYESGKGWVIHDPAYYGEFLVYPVANFELELSVTNALMPVVVAASSLPVEASDGYYQYSLSEGRNFVLSLSTDFQVRSEVVDGITVSSYFFPYETRAGETALRNTVEAVDLYKTLFGNLERTSLSVVQADFLDGMEYDGLYFLSKGFYNLYDGTPKGYLTAIAVHETAHQWWYGVVANDQAMEPWLDEALSTYSELLYYEHYYPELVDWWWGYRVWFYDPQGAIDRPVYDYRGFRPYRDAVYLNGAVFLQELRELMGEDAFFEAIRGYLETNRRKIAAAEDFFEVIFRYSPTNPKEVIDRYFDDMGN